MNLLHVIGTMDPRWGGPVEGVRQSSVALARMGHRDEIVTLDRPDRPWLTEYPMACPVHPLGQGPSLGKYAYTPRLVPWLREHANRFDVVIVHGVWQYQSLGVWRALKGSKIPYIFYPHGGLESWSLGLYPLKTLKKRVYWRLFEHRVLRDSRSVFFTTEDEREVSAKAFRPYQARETLIDYGIIEPPDDDQGKQIQAFFDRYPALRDKRYIAYLGRLHPHKGCDLLIQAFAAVAAEDPELNLVMIGPDQLGWRVELQRLAEQLGVANRVTFTGMLTGALKWGAIRSAEAFSLPSHFENFGISVVEAMACGKPVLLSNKVSIWRGIVADGAGVVGTDDAQGITSILKRWVALSPEERRRMGERASSCFVERFHIDRATTSLVEALRSLGVNDDRQAALIDGFKGS